MARLSPFANLAPGTALALAGSHRVRNRRRRPVLSLAMDCDVRTVEGWIAGLAEAGLLATLYLDIAAPSGPAPAGTMRALARRITSLGHEFGLLGDPRAIGGRAIFGDVRNGDHDLLPTAFALAPRLPQKLGRMARARGFATCRGKGEKMMTETIDLAALAAITDPGDAQARRAVLARAVADRAFLLLKLDARAPFGEAGQEWLRDIHCGAGGCGIGILTVRNALGALAF